VSGTGLEGTLSTKSKDIRDRELKIKRGRPNDGKLIILARRSSRGAVP
jgi:hypothetical protein